MPLKDGYGVLLGTKHKYYRDALNNYGQYFHGNLEVKTPAGIYKCAIDVDSKHQPNGVLWRVIPVKKADLKGVDALADGWHALASNKTSGALDYLREPYLRAGASSEWKSGTSIDALTDLEPLLTSPKRVAVFGEPFRSGRGVHNIHQNQGDPPGQWWSESGIWQSGATFIQRANGTWVAFLNKFKTQASRTDKDGHPLKSPRRSSRTALRRAPAS